MDEISRPSAIQRFESLGAAASRAHGEFVETVHRHRRTWSFENARGLRRQCDGAERSLGEIALVARSLNREISIEPAVSRALHVRGAGLHIVLRIEVRPRRTRRSDCVYRSQ